MKNVAKTLRSRFIEILLNNPEISSLSEDKLRDRIGRILEDLDQDNILDEINYDDNYFDWGDDLAEMSDIEFDEGRTDKQKAVALEFLQKPKETRREENEDIVTLESLKRIREKRRELALNPESGIVLDDNDFEEEERASKGEAVMPNSYGRSPLHEAIGMRNLEAIRKFVAEGKYIGDIDNNGNTPFQMAYQEGYEEAVEVFENACVAA